MLWLDHQAPAFHKNADLRSGLKVQHVEERGRYRQHDRTADFAKICCMHLAVIFQYNRSLNNSPLPAQPPL